jgi:hypothetical protein
MAEEDRPHAGGGWLPPSDHEYTPPDSPNAPAAGPGDPHAGPGNATPPGAHEGWIPPSGEQGGTDPFGRETSSHPSGGQGWSNPSGGQGWPAPAGGAPQQPPTGTVPASNGKATASLVLGIVGLVFCPLVASVLAVVLGYQARSEIDASQGGQTNRGSAVAGIVTGWVGIGLTVLVVIAYLLTATAGPEEDDDRSVGVPAVRLAARVVTALL